MIQGVSWQGQKNLCWGSLQTENLPAKLLGIVRNLFRKQKYITQDPISRLPASIQTLERSLQETQLNYAFSPITVNSCPRREIMSQVL
jgi:hypothetical protein